jgi:serine phosphatase RsbU (regulator of sigma subunit)
MDSASLTMSSTGAGANVTRTPATPVARPAASFVLSSSLRVAAKQSAQADAGGDFFEVFQHADGRVSVVIADVCGSGLVAAQIAGALRPAMHGILSRGESPARVLSALNDGLIGLGALDKFVTAVALRIDVRLGTAELACAGHLGPFVRRADGFARATNAATDVPLGFLAGESFREATIDLTPGDALVLVTDGVTDPLATAADPLGAEALVQRLEMLGPARAAASTDEAVALCDALLDDGIPWRDDATVLVLHLATRDFVPAAA